MNQREQHCYKQLNLCDKLRLYGILGSENLQGITHREAVSKAIKGGMTCVQIREKKLSRDELVDVISEIKPLCDEAEVPLIINDDTDICSKTDACGVHLGLGDGSIEEARNLLGESKIIGATAHNLEEALAAEAAGADYIGVGAAFGSKSKFNAVKLPSLDVYNMITASVNIPVVAIGGINRNNISDLEGRGLSGVAVISALFSSSDIKKRAEELRAYAKKLSGGMKRASK